MQGARYEKCIERRTVHGGEQAFAPDPLRERIVRRTAREVKDGYYVNLGIGMPTLASNYVPAGVSIVLPSENGMLGVGPYPEAGQEDPDLINAGKETVTELPGTSYFSSAASFAMVRGGHVDLTILGALQVDLVAELEILAQRVDRERRAHEVGQPVREQLQVSEILHPLRAAQERLGEP